MTKTSGCLSASWWTIVAIVAVGAGLAAQRQTDKGPPFSPDAALATLAIEDGFRIGLFAHEPQTASPVAMDVDEDGRIFVVEMPGYPLDTTPTGRVRLLEDTDRDGRVDRSTVFAEGLVLPTGVLCWKKGVLVTAAPDLVYFEDTNGDRRADVRRVVVTGFAVTNPQHTVNTPVYGLDNWIELAHEGPAEAIIFKDKFGDRGGPLRFADEGGRDALPPRERSIRVHLDPPRAVEARSGSSQFGHAFDEFGRYFTLDNSNHARHEVVAARYLERNPDLVIARAMANVSDHGEAAEVFPITRNPRFELLSEVGQMTSACSLTFYQGGAWPERFAGSAFVAEPVHNLVHRDVYTPSGATFTAARGTVEREFLASSDAWFRPVSIYNAPDGSLIVIDYYRRVIEHPEWTASDLHRDSPALYDGRDRGRLYRVVPASTTLDAWPQPGQLRGASDAELVGMLGHRNIWWRRTAQRLLVDRKSDASIPLLEAAALSRPTALARLHALWTLDGLGRSSAPLLAVVLEDPEPGIRENAIRLIERHLVRGTAAGRDALVSQLLSRVTDTNARVRFQLLATLGSIDIDAARVAHEQLLLAYADDEWMQVAGLSASSDRAARLLRRALVPSDRSSAATPTGDVAAALVAAELPGRALFLERLASIVAARGDRRELDAVFERLVAARTPDRAWWRAAILRGLAQGLRGENRAAGRAAAAAHQADVLSMVEESSDLGRAALDLVRAAGYRSDAASAPIVERAVETAQSRDARDEARVNALVLIRLAGAGPHAAWLQRLVAPEQPEPVQGAALQALATVRGPELGRRLIARWTTFTPAVRSDAAQALLADPDRTKLLVDALRDGRVPSWSLDFWQKRDLVMNDDEAVRRDSRALLEEKPAERQAIVERYRAALDLEGNAERGREVFKNVCAACHRVQGIEGQDLGPDLDTVRHKPLSALLTDILLPSRAIAQKYETYLVERTGGGKETGVLGSQTPTSITLRQQGREIVIARSDIRSMVVVPQSAMPPDLDKVIDPKQMADLLTFLVRGTRRTGL